MTASSSNENLLFDYRTLRLIIGAIAFAFPCVVFLIAAKITTSISSSYHTDAQDFFVGFLFIIGALLLSYKGYVRRTASVRADTLWGRVHRYQEDTVSAIGGAAAFLTALFPTSCDGCAMDWKAGVHYGAAIVLFSTVVYFCLVAFLRRLNEKMLNYDELRQDEDLMAAIDAIRGITPGRTGFWRRVRNFLFREPLIFLRITVTVAKLKGLNAAVARNAGVRAVLTRTKDVVFGHGKKLARGYVYLGCGLFIAVLLVGLLLAMSLLPDATNEFKFTFWAETLALWAFGAAWMTASKLPFLRKIHLYLLLRRRVHQLVQRPA